MLKTVLRGTVTEVAEDGVYVEVPKLGIGMQFGPCEVPVNIALVPGDRVVVAQVEDVAEDIVIINKIGIVGTDPGGGGGGGSPSGPAGGDLTGTYPNPTVKYVTLPFVSPSSTWTCAHGLNRIPVEVVTLDSSGEEMIGDVTYVDVNTILINWYAPQTGTAYITI